MNSNKEKNLGVSKQINVSKRGYSYIYIDKAKIIVSKGTLVYLQKEKNKELFFNIPYLNCSVIALGPGTSITNEAVRLAANNSVIIIFVNSIYKPSANTLQEFSVLAPSSEYKPNEYMQAFSKIFFDEDKRLEKAKYLLIRRIELTSLIQKGLVKDDIISQDLQNTIKLLGKDFYDDLIIQPDTRTVLLSEARYTKNIFREFAQHYSIPFKKNNDYKKSDIGSNSVNSNLLNINYILYGMSASALVTLNISFAFPLLHGKTRRGALVFDIADLLKDGLSIPLSFYANKKNLDDREVRDLALDYCSDMDLFSTLFREIIGITKLKFW